LTIVGGTQDEALWAPPLPDDAQPASIAMATAKQGSRTVPPTRGAP
jgi:hypothetical protein